MSFSSDSKRFDFLSWPIAAEAASQKGSTLVWPFGACEQHGPHLPLITDTFFAENVLKDVFSEINDEFPIWMLPSQFIGFSPEHQSFPGTLSLSANTLLQLVTEVGCQIAKMGFKRLVLFNAHGGQIGLLQAIARELRIKCPSMSVLPCFLWSGVSSLEEIISEKEIEEGLHAAEAETSLMMHYFPEIVGNERPSNSVFENKLQNSEFVTPEGWSLEGAAPCAWLTKDLSESGVIGDSRLSNSELGLKLKKALVEHWIKLFTSLMKSSWPPTN